MGVTIALSLNLKGMLCPLPIMKRAKAMNQLAPSVPVIVLATDAVWYPTSRRGRKRPVIRS